MAPKKQTNSASNKRGSAPGPPSRGLNFRPPAPSTDRDNMPNRSSASGSASGPASGPKRPLPDPSSVWDILFMTVLFLCKKLLFVRPLHKVSAYIAVVFVGSIITDFQPLPKSYFARSSNMLNQYFVKLGWGWTLATAGSFLLLTSTVYCCGEAKRVYRHCVRLLVGTVAWYVCTNSFSWMETLTKKCVGAPTLSREACLARGMQWRSLDISGHVFILMYSSLFLIEEARAIMGWESLRDSIRIEDHRRYGGGDTDEDYSTTGLSILSGEQFEGLQRLYEQHTPYVKLVFLWMTFLVVLWDWMLLMTVLYFHSAAEKIPSSLVAVAAWGITYHVWYRTPFSPGMPGEGAFKYMESKQTRENVPISRRREGSLTRSRGSAQFGRSPLFRQSNNPEERDNVSNEERETATQSSLSKRAALASLLEA